MIGVLVGLLDYWELIVVFVLGFFVVVLCLQATLARWEKRMVWPYGDLQAEPHFGDPSGYARRYLNEAVQLGWHFLGWAPDLKGNLYQISYAFLVAPEGDCLAIVGVGNVATIRLEGTWMHSPARDDARSWFSTDNQACLETDLSRLWTSQLVHAFRFQDLWQKHRAWVNRCGVPLLKFEPARALDQFRRCREARCHEMARLGLIVYTDTAQSRWRYTWPAGLKIAVRSLFSAFLHASKG